MKDVGKARDPLIVVLEQLKALKNRSSEERYRTFIELANDPIFVAEIETGIIVDVNQKGEELLGMRRPEIIGMHQSQLHPPDDTTKGKTINTFRNHIKQGRADQDETQVIRKDGTIVDVSISAKVIDTGNEKLIIGIFRDITRRNKLIEELRFHSEIMRNMAEGVILVSVADGTIVYCNPKFEQIFEYNTGELIGKNVSIINAPTEKSPEETSKEIMESLNKNNSWQGEVYTIKKNGTHFWGYVSISSFEHNTYGNVWVGVHSDITEQKLQAQLLIQQSKMASMGEMIGLIAHQWRQPLNALSLYVQDLKESYKYGEIDEHYIEHAANAFLEQIDFMSNTIDDFRDFFAPTKIKVQFNITSAINKLLTMFSHIYTKSSIGLSITDKCDMLLYVDGYPNEFNQVVLNLLNNAREAILSTRKLEPKLKGQIEINISTNGDRNRVVCSIWDNAGGILENIMDKIFEPHFTTKESKGMGLGLYMSKTIIENNMNGKLSVHNRDGGAEFKITLKATAL
ncbi:MAG: PAS domain S-box protein [Nitrospirae bacterium]|nr:PAS domain S-box protein [Nitrospirota bacterium]